MMNDFSKQMTKRYVMLAMSAAFALLFLFNMADVSAVTAENSSQKVYLIKNATVHTATAKGKLLNVDILLKGKNIIQVDRGLKVSGSPIVIDAQGKHVTPGFINAATQLGLVEINAVSGTVDYSTSHVGMGSSFNIAPAVHFESTLIPQNRMNGLTRAIVLPRSKNSIFAGQGVVIALHSSLRGMLIDHAAQVATYGLSGASIAKGSRAAAMQTLDKSLIDSKYLRKNENHYLPGYQWSFSQPIDDLKALYPVLDKTVPLIVIANRSDDILRLIALAKKHRIKLVISGGGEAWKVAEALAQAQVPVIIDPIQNIPTFDSLDVKLDSAALLYRAGVKLMLKGGGTHNAYLVRQSAGNAVAYGMPAEAAIEAMTINTAEVFGIENYGQIKPGMEADIVIWDGDPLEVTSIPDAVFIQGEKQLLVSRASRLVDRYWNLKGNHQQAFMR